jgi:hypothetical protein
MSKRHKHYDVIVAWAEGKEIQFFDSDENQWRDWGYTSCPSFSVTSECRIKPENPYDMIINQAIREVDFESIHKIMIALDWKYISKYYGNYIPSIEQLKEQLREMCSRVLVEKSALISSGIFSVSIYNGSLRIQVTAVDDTFVYLGGK